MANDLMLEVLKKNKAKAVSLNSSFSIIHQKTPDKIVVAS